MKIPVRDALLLSIFVAMCSMFVFSRLKPAGLFGHNEGYYSLEARGARGMVAGLKRVIKGEPIADIKHHIRYESGGIFPTGMAKPGFIFLLTAFSYLVGFDDVTIALLASLSAALTLPFVYLIGWRLRDSATGLSAAFVLSFLIPFIHIARLGMPNTVAGLFLIAGTWAVIENRYLAGGFLIGFGMTCHYAMLISIAFFIPTLSYHLWHGVRDRQISTQEAVRCGRNFVVGLAFLPFLWEAGYWVIKIALRGELSDFNFHTYFYWIIHQLVAVTPKATSHPWQLSYFPSFYLTSQGWVGAFFILASSGFFIFSFIRRRRLAPVLFTFALGVLVPIFWMLKPGYIAIRVIALFIPFQAIFIGYLIGALKPKILRVALPLVLAISALPQINNLFGFKSGYAEAAQWVKSHDETQVVSFLSWVPWQFYLGPKQVFNHHLEAPEDEIKNAVKAGKVRYLAVDYEIRGWTGARWEAWGRNIVENNRPVKTFSNPWVCEPITTWQVSIRNPGYSPPEEACVIRLYDLAEIYPPPPRSTGLPVGEGDEKGLRRMSPRTPADTHRSRRLAKVGHNGTTGLPVGFHGKKG